MTKISPATSELREWKSGVIGLNCGVKSVFQPHYIQAIPGESPYTILTNKCVAGSNWGRDELVNVLCPLRAYEKIF